MEEFLGKIVSAETEEFLRVLYPRFIIEREFDAFSSKSSIYTGNISTKTIEKLKFRGYPFIVWVEEGGEIALTRELLFSYCIRRRRNYKPHYDELDVREFVNMCRILKVCDLVPQEDDDDSSVYQLFVLLSKKSKTSIKYGLDLCGSMGSMQVLYSVITFFSRVVAGADSGSFSPQYTAVIKRAEQNKAAYIKAMKTVPIHSRSQPELLLLMMIFGVVS